VPSGAKRDGGLVGAAGIDDRGGGTGSRSFRRSRSSPGAALYHQADLSGRRGFDETSERAVRVQDRRGTCPARASSAARIAEQPWRVGENAAVGGMAIEQNLHLVRRFGPTVAKRSDRPGSARESWRRPALRIVGNQRRQ